MAKPDDGLRAIFHEKLKPFHMVAIETGMTTQGVPDSNGCFNGVDFWVEMKATKAFAVRFRPMQIGWIERRLRCGGHVFVATRQRHKNVDCLWLLRGSAAKELATGASLRSLKASYILGCWHGGPQEWPWNLVKSLLLNG